MSPLCGSVVVVVGSKDRNYSAVRRRAGEDRTLSFVLTISILEDLKIVRQHPRNSRSLSSRILDADAQHLMGVITCPGLEKDR